jgi:hypothetical protein
VLVQVEAVPKRAGEHAAAGGGPDNGELLQREIDRPADYC